MINLNIEKKKEIFPIILILILALSRLIPHPPNFTPIIAVAIMSSYLFRNIYFSLTVLLISMLLSDFIIGFYKNMFFVYVPLFLITYLFYKITKKINIKNLFLFSFLGAFIFYLVSNFGVWFTGSLYEKNLNGLIECYLLAIPYFKNTVFSTIFFSYLAFFVNYLYLIGKKSYFKN